MIKRISAIIISLVIISLFSLQSYAYETSLFDRTCVHEINIKMDNWDEFLKNCPDEVYFPCDVIIDGEEVKNIGIRSKGNASLKTVQELDSNRYSFKIEFDHYDKNKNYKGLDKLCLNNFIQDNTYMKDYVSYVLMQDFGVVSPLCSYVYITVNDKDWGLYLAVEGVEDSFLNRNYGNNYGELYKPDHEDGNERVDKNDDKKGAKGSDAVKLKYIDDNFNNYNDIFENAKTDISDEDKTRLMQSLKSLYDKNNIESVVDTDQVIKYFVVHNFLCNDDSYTGQMIHNYYLYEKDGKMSMIPWDYNLAFGALMNDTDPVNIPIDEPIKGDINDRPMIAWIFDDYKERYHNEFREFIKTDFDKLINDTAELIDPYVQKDPTKFCTYDEFKKSVSVLSDFCKLRSESIENQLDNKRTKPSHLDITAMGVPSSNTENAPQRRPVLPLIIGSSLIVIAIGTIIVVKIRKKDPA